MSTSELHSARDVQAEVRRPLVDSTFLRWIVALNGLVPFALLVWDGLHDDLGANAVNHAIHTTGLVGLVMLLLTLAVTPLRVATGWPTIIAARRPLGLLAFFYLLAHFMIFFAFDRAGSVSSTVTEILERTYLQLGFIALVLMAALALTSTDGMVMRLGAKRWKRLHRLIYPIAILGVVHFLLLVKSDLRVPRAFAIALGALLLYRVGALFMKPAKATSKDAVGPVRFFNGELVVARITPETHDVRTFRMTSPEGPLPFRPTAGQYLNLALTIGGKRVSRSYTISGASDAWCEITVKRAADGYASHHMHDLVREGDRLRVSAPAGRFVFDGRGHAGVVLIAGGVGITPLMAVIRDLTRRSWPGQMTLVYGVRGSGDVIFEAELRALAERFANLRLLITLSDAASGHSYLQGRIGRELLENALGSERATPILLCGPEPMMKAVTAELIALGVAPEAIATEAFVSPPAGSDAPLELEAGVAVEATARFEKSKRDVRVTPPSTLLEAAEAAGLALPFECRSGICGQCKVRLISGRVHMLSQDALSASDRNRGLILACQAHPTGDVVLDA